MVYVRCLPTKPLADLCAIKHTQACAHLQEYYLAALDSLATELAVAVSSLFSL